MKTVDKLNELLADKTPNYIFPFFWQHGEDEATLREYMNVIHGSNIGAVCVESRPHPDFAKTGWWHDLDIILDEAKKLAMQVWILDDAHFPTGYAAGAVETAPPELCHQYLNYNTVSICGPKPCIELNVERYAHPQPTPPWMPPQPTPNRVFNDDRLVKVIACPVEDGGKFGNLCDLTGMVKDGLLVWDVPEGYWTIHIIYLTRDANGRNDYINLLDRASCRLLIDAVYEPHYARYNDLFGNVIAGFFSDEPPIGNTPGYTMGDTIGKPDMPLPWSEAMPERIAAEYGEGWLTELPLLWADGSDKHATARIRTAYMNAVSKLVSECFSEQLGLWCHERGVEYIGHMLEDCDASSGLGPSMGHFFRGLSGQHMAGIDNIGGQVMIGGQHVQRRPGGMCQDDAGFYHYTLGRMGASMAAIDPKKKGRCMCENYGAYGWQIGVRTEKYLTDHFLARGVNRYVPHAFSPKAFPDPDCPPHFYAHGENPQIRAFGHLMAYTNRICHLIDGGIPQVSVALLYHGESQWAGSYQSNILACREFTRHQIGFVIIPADVFETPKAYNAVFNKESNLLTINGMEIRALVISGCEYLPYSAARFAVDAHDNGFPVVITSPVPVGVSDASKSGSDALAERLKSCTVTDVKKLVDALEEYITRDAILEEPFEDLTVYHYSCGNDVYLLLNESPSRGFEGSVTLSSTEKAVGYDAWTNSVYSVPSDAAGGHTRLNLTLTPLEMRIVIVGDNLPVVAAPVFSGEETAIRLDNFKVTRATAREYPHFHSMEDADLRHGMACKHPEFSGYYRYEAMADMKKGASAVLQIKNAYESAEVFVNGKSAGLITAPPYRYNVSNLVKDGENHIAIEVATTLERKAAALGIDVACMNAPAPLSPTGIVGDVVLLVH